MESRSPIAALAVVDMPQIHFHESIEHLRLQTCRVVACSSLLEGVYDLCVRQICPCGCRADPVPDEDFEPLPHFHYPIPWFSLWGISRPTLGNAAIREQIADVVVHLELLGPRHL